jgi:hypothetical protein
MVLSDVMCAMVDSVHSDHIRNIMNSSVCNRGDTQTHQEVNVLQDRLWLDRGCDREKACVAEGVL